MSQNKSDSYKIPDTQVKQAIDDLNKKINDISDTTVKHFNNEVKRGESNKVDTGKFYTDSKSDDPNQKRGVINIKGKLYYFDLTEMDSDKVSGDSGFSDDYLHVINEGDSTSNFSDYVINEGVSNSEFTNYMVEEGNS